MNFKNHQYNGFALLEVMIALAMIAGLLSVLLVVQGKVFRNAAHSTFKVERFYAIRNMFLRTKTKTPADDQDVIQTWQTTDQQTETQLKYQRKELNSASELARFKGLYQEVATGSWYEGNKQVEYSIVNYGFEPPKEKKNEAA